MKIGGVAVAALVLLSGTPMRMSAQQAASSEIKDADLGAQIKVDVDVVTLYATVHNKQGGLVGNLTKDDFDLAEDGKAQTIKYFSRETDIPLTMGLEIDVSGSQQNLIEIERQAGAQFFNSMLKAKDEAFLISFGADSDLLQDVTGSPRLLQQGLQRLKLNTGYSGPTAGPVPTMNHQAGTVLYDAVYLGSHDMLAQESGRKALILITDGEDEGSKLGIKDAIEAAQKADVIIYGILYVDRGFYGGFNIGYSGEGALKQMAEETGGRVFRVSGKETLPKIFDEIQQEMRTQYLLGYTPTNDKKDGTFRKIDLRTHEKDQKVQVRKGYYALAEKYGSN
ncbi:MAG TPA: VWA domain-containing protein [Bryobacteraceae bacterium]|nr:VWA domain-containing protein [Bryobacteraceae bacterium]